jgi:hypothetical protein
LENTAKDEESMDAAIKKNTVNQYVYISATERKQEAWGKDI